MSDRELHSGGCACGAIRFSVSSPPVMVAYCHCEDCRKSCGSAVAAMAGFPRAGFQLTGKKPNYFSNTAGVNRSFCNNCGSPLFYENENFFENIYIHIGTFDEPERLPPDRHTWVADRVPWHEIRDDLAQYEKLSNAGLADNTPPYRGPTLND